MSTHEEAWHLARHEEYVEHIESKCVDLWRLADEVSLLDVEHIAANATAITEARDKLNLALNQLPKG